MKEKYKFQKFVCSLVIFAVVFSQNSILALNFIGGVAEAAEVEEGPNNPDVVYDLVVLVVDTAMNDDASSYFGLRDDGYLDKLDETTIGRRVLRYAEDIRVNNALTDVKLLFFDKRKDSVESLASALENLYINGDGAHKNKLTGVVLIGDVPLPVVNKNGNRFISMLPYTDFVDKAYIFNEKIKNFEANSDLEFLNPELWHGVIRAPSQNAEGREKLAEFFDKNHLYYQGEDAFAKFDRKMFFGDFVHEQEQLNSDMYLKYLKYLESVEDLTYQRFNKFWASELMQETVADLPVNEENSLNQSQNGEPGFAEMLKSDNALANVPDIYTKNIIEQNLPPYFKLLAKYVGKVNDWTSYTGRYSPYKIPSGVHTAASLIAIKDEYTRQYLRNVNSAFEKKINEIAEKIQEPLPILEYSVLSGRFEDSNEDFRVGVVDNSTILPEPLPLGDSKKVYLRYNYLMEANDKMYVNGVDADLLESPKQCSVYLGSTKSEYYDPETLDFNPKAVGGKYSILTRALRSDNMSTAVTKRTAGINTRILSTYSISNQPSELARTTNNAYAGNINEGVQETGEIIEDNPKYGVSAFILNPYAADYKNPFDEILNPGDVISNVNGKNISYKYTFQDAIEEAYKNVEKVIKAVNDRRLDRLKNFPYKVATYVPAPLENPLADTVIVHENAQEILGSQRLQNAIISEDDKIAAAMSIEYYRGAQKKSAVFTFTVNVDSKEDGKILLTSTSNAVPEGNPKMMVILSNHGFPENFYDESTDGALFSLYENDTLGFGGDAYDSSAGCNFRSASRNSDRCFAKLATMAVLDPAGAIGLIKIGNELAFPDNIKKNDENENSENPADYEKNVPMFQFPGGKVGDHYQYEDIDEVYYDACYDGLPAVAYDGIVPAVNFSADLSKDSNPYAFPLDITSEAGENKDVDRDFYGRLLNSFAAFLESDKSDEPDYEDGGDGVTGFDPKEEIWLGMSDLDASEIILNDPIEILGVSQGVDKEVTLKDFSDFYGLPSGNLKEIARKMLSHDAVYTVPFVDEDITLRVETKKYKDKEVSSVIVHDEPTDYTISQQVKSQSAFSLPIDNPRYVAFLVENQTQRIDYLNLFALEKEGNVQQIKANLAVEFAKKADEIAKIKGSYKIFGLESQEGDYTLADIKEKILSDYFSPVIGAASDNPPDGFDLAATSEKKIIDAVQWLNMNIDDKHKYILSNYLNADKDHYGYVNDASVFPAIGADIGYGYESAYLVFDGDQDYIDYSFNKALPRETDEDFDPLSLAINGPPGGEQEEEDRDGGDGSEGDDWVWLDKFYEELMRFLDGFTSVPKFEDACSFAQEVRASVGGEFEQTEAEADLGEAALGLAAEEEVVSKKVIIHTYTLSEIGGFDEAKEKIEAGEGSGEGSGDGAEDGGNGSGEDGDGVDGENENAGAGGGGSGQNGSNGTNEGAGDGLGEKIQKLLAKENAEDQLNKAEAESGESTDGDGSDDVNENEAELVGENESDRDDQKDGENIDESGSKNDQGSNSSASSGNSDKDITILKSKPVDDKGETDVAQTWTEYFLETKYYEKFLPNSVESKFSYLVATLFNDQSAFTDAAKNPESKFELESGSELIADGKSLLQIEADVLAIDGTVEIDKVHDVRFSIENVDVKTDLGEPAFFENTNTVKSERGKAIAYLKAGKRSGKIKVIAEVLNSNGNVDGKYLKAVQEVNLIAGEPINLDIETESNFLPANGQAKTKIKIILKDKFGNIARNAFNQIAVFVDPLLSVDKNVDIDAQLIGVQLQTFDGEASLNLNAKNQAGKASLIAVLVDSDLQDLLLAENNQIENIDFTKYIGKTKQIELVDKNSLSLELNAFDVNFEPTNEVPADGNSIVRLGSKLLLDGEVAKSFNGPIKFKILDQSFGKFLAAPPEKMIDGAMNPANLNFRAATRAGDVEILAEIPGFISNSFKFQVVAGDPTRIELIASENVLYTSDREGISLEARLMDNNGNLASRDSGTLIEFAATEATKDFVEFSNERVETTDGLAKTKVTAKNLSGMVNIKAISENLSSDLISLDIRKRLSRAEIEDFSPRALYIALLGGAFGKIEKTKNLAETLLYSKSQTQAVTALSASTNEKKRLLYVDSYGKSHLFDPNIKAEIVQATSSFPYQKILFSEALKKNPLAELFVVPKAESEVVLLNPEGKDLPNEENIYIKQLSNEEGLTFEEKIDGIYIQEGSENIVKIDKFGRVSISDENVKLSLAEENQELEAAYFSFVISRLGTNLAQVIYKQNFNKDVQDTVEQGFFPGVYLQKKTESSSYALTAALSGSSSNEALGKYLIDLNSEIDASQTPSGSYLSLESASKQFGVGYEGDNKQMLFFAAGNSLGESSLPYTSEAAITFGDPLIRLKVEEDLISPDTHYSKDIGKPIYSSQKAISKMIEFDFNGDNYDDILLAYEDGFVRLLQNEISNKRFRDLGYILNVINGIFSMTKIDVNNDGYDDLIVGTKESCRKDAECITLFENQDGQMLRRDLNLALGGKKAYEMKADDMDQDGCEDLVVSDSSGGLSIFYNQSNGEDCLGLNTNPGLSRNFGFTIEDEVNLADQVFVNYPAVERPNNIDPSLEDGSNAYKFIQIVLANGDRAEEFNFINLKEDAKLGLNSRKQAIDENGGSVEVGDKINYLISLRNSSGTNINNLMISDNTPTSLTLLPESLQCLTLNCSDEPEFVETGLSLRSHVIRNINLPANGERIIKYSMIVNQMPTVKFDIGNNFADYEVDRFKDIFVKPEVNPDGIVTYIYSKGPRTYAEKKVIPGAVSQKDILDATFSANGIPSPEEALAAAENQEVDEETQEQIDALADNASKDSDYNGCVDSWQKGLQTYQNVANAVAGAVEGTLTALRCNGGGCLPNPYNYALFAPDFATPGIAVFAAGTPNFPWVAGFYPSVAPSAFRFYISPTATLGLGTAVCVGPGPGHASPCYAFAIPGGVDAITSAVGAPGPCQGINKLIEKAGGELNHIVNKAKESWIDSDTGLGAVISDGEGAVADDPEAVNIGGNYADPDSPFSAAASVNIKIPGFPSVITNWLDKQTDEIYNKLLDLPKFYLILPDVEKLGSDIVDSGSKVNFRSFHDFLSSVSRIPLIQIEGREIVVKVPAISQKEIYKYERQAKLWLEHMDKELEKYYTWNCDETPDKRNICDKILLDVTSVISSIKELLEFLDQIANLPRDILNYRNLEAKYATQIICYLDAIMNFTGGYIKKQERIITSWLKAIEQILEAFKSWKMLLDMILEYQQSCDQCKSDRFSKLGLLLQLFVAIPEPPVVPLPKLPDVVVDLSNIKTGVKIVWPDVVFRPQPILLPDLPEITLPDVIPSLAIKIDFDLNLPDLSKWQFMIPDLPDLPPLPIPQLPDLPRPPKIPNINALVADLIANLKPIFKILCLLKNGLIPVPEAGLATEIETLTQPSIQVVIPFIKNLALQWPPIQYDDVKEVRVNAKLNFDIDTSLIYLAADKFAQDWNEKVKLMVEGLNRFSRLPYGQMISQLLQKAVDEAKKAAEKKIKKKLNDDGAVEIDANSEARALDQEIKKFIAELEVEEDPDAYYLTATETLLNPNDPLLQRSIKDVEQDIKNRKEDFADNPYMAQMQNLRDQLIAYTKDLEKSNNMLAGISDNEQFATMLAKADQNLGKISGIKTEKIAAEKQRIAATEVPKTLKVERKMQFSLFGEYLDKQIQNFVLNGFSEEERELLAGHLDFNAQSGGGNNSATIPLGFYVSAGDVNENVLNYTAELKNNTQLIFSDADQDGDTDIIYSMGGDVYLKNNYKFNEPLSRGNLIVAPANAEIDNYVNKGGTAIQGVKINLINNKKIDLSWQAHSAETYSYELVLRNSLFDSEEESAYTFTFLVDDLTDKNNPSASLDIENGNYFVTVHAIDKDGKKSLPSNPVIAAPQVCADTEPPLPVISLAEGGKIEQLGGSDFEVAIFQELVLDAKGSFDEGGEIAKYFVETLAFESGELKTTVFPQIIYANQDNPIFKFKFDNEGDPGKHEFVLHTVDQNGYEATQNFSITVLVPKITLDETVATSAVASGETNPNTAKMPFKLMRNRYIYRVLEQELKLIPRLDVLREALTDANGKYSISNFDLEKMILVENGEGKIVAEIHPETSNILIKDSSYKVRVNEAEVPTLPTSLDVVNKFGEELGSVYLVGDSNNDVKIHQQLGIDKDNYRELFGVNIDDTTIDEFMIINIPANDPNNPGAAVLVNKTSGKMLLLLDTGGNIQVFDQSVGLAKKANDHKTDPLIIEVKVKGKVIAEIYISPESSMKIVGPNDVPFAFPHGPNEGFINNSGLSGVAALDGLKASEKLEGIVEDFYKKGILDSSGDDIKAEDSVKRKEFVKVLINMLCIIPREEAYQAFKAGEGYSDIEFNAENLDVFYPYIREGTLLGLIEGYKGEPDENNLFPFKPENTISRAEGVKIILEALEMKGVLNLENLKEGEPWYDNFMSAAQDLTPYLSENISIKNNFIITPEEAVDPNKAMTFEELLIMVERVLDIYNCFEIDEDADEMSDFCEEKYGIDDPNKDEDEDELSNREECLRGLNPTNKDSDNGGESDGNELRALTDPFNPADDPKDEDNDGLSYIQETQVYGTDPYDPDTDDGAKDDGTEVAECKNPLNKNDDSGEAKCKSEIAGIYIVPSECNTCPCISTFLNKAELLAGDIIFPVISRYYQNYFEEAPFEKNYIFTKGNEVEIQSIIKNQ